MGPRERAVARWKALAAAGVVAGCGGATTSPGYGVVDPLPPPSCFEAPKPTVTVKLRPEVEKDGSRHVEVVVVFEQVANVGKLQATATGKPLELTEQAVHAHDFRLVLRAPKDATTIDVVADVDCGRSSDFTATLELDASSVKVVSVR